MCCVPAGSLPVRKRRNWNENSQSVRRKTGSVPELADGLCRNDALRLLGISEEDEVIVPAYTYTATASVVCHGGKIGAGRCAEGSLEMDYEQLENAITERTKVIIPVDLGGIPCDYDRIFSIVEGKSGCFIRTMRYRKPSEELLLWPIVRMHSVRFERGCRWEVLQIFLILVFMR